MRGGIVCFGYFFMLKMQSLRKCCFNMACFNKFCNLLYKKIKFNPATEISTICLLTGTNTITTLSKWRLYRAQICHSSGKPFCHGGNHKKMVLALRFQVDVYLIEKITYKDKNTPLVRSGNRYSSIVPVILAIDDVIKNRLPI